MYTKQTPYQNEAELLAALLRKEEKAFTFFYQKTHKRLLTSLYYWVGDQQTAEDLLQECFMRFWEKVPLYQPTDSNLQTWMKRLSRNYAFSYLLANRKRRYHQSLNDEATGDLLAAEVSHHRQDDWSFAEVEPLVLPLNRLSLICRQALELYYQEGLSYLQMAEELNIPLTTVRTRLHQAKQELKRYLPANSYHYLLPLAQRGGLRL